MKKIFKYILMGAVVIGVSSCKKYLDINTNPNNFTSSTPALVLPQAIVAAAASNVSFSQTLADISGARANAGGFGGFGDVVTYDFNTSTFAGLWTQSYDNANDFQYVINETSADPTAVFSTSIARIMKALVFERLVNQFNDVPYSDALKGVASLQPKYDKGPDIYKASIADLDKAIADIIAGQAAGTSKITAIPATADPLFGGTTVTAGVNGMDRWKQFAQTIKLRMLIKMAGVPAHSAYATAEFAKLSASIGFLTADAVVQPGYVQRDRPSPVYSALGFSATGTNVLTSRIPSKWIFSFYSGAKIIDPGRGSVIYRNFSSTTAPTPINQLGDESAGVPQVLAAGSTWNTSTANTNTIGIAKSPTQATPMLLLTESKFLQAEAVLRGYITTALTGGSSAEALYSQGITASFNYLYKDGTGAVPSTKNPTTDAATYLTANSVAGNIIGNNLTNWNEQRTQNPTTSVITTAVPTTEQRIERIITQKYIALNSIANDENYNEFRRTGYPAVVNNAANDPLSTFASRQSVSTHSDKLPTRVLYPQEEYNLNPVNAPAGINKFSSLIFWDLN
ncbi:SusD/RagB family nutrient-binding outer membrane lipoprotein [Pedobacter polaris]|uniref:SusD/RagB family nutrient-binding outer membrane lipoprotein n=1 Tax=Pedobacter polaris TaxID=2571273 RepID=A0A4U1CUB5_9SPHI|nr:SusD/RagB family nutrient-binding outer membrane lipoprotein [Pedobacter polaris]TKC12423.1 SusD/RagB family nutrient-binding outer membrane lipoprotein [Pedobacter polaris]